AGTATRVSLSTSGRLGLSGSCGHSIWADCRYVVFESDASLATGDGSSRDIFVRDLATTTTTLIYPIATNANSYNADISSDGRYVSFSSSATNLIAGDTNGVDDVFRVDRSNGSVVRVSVDPLGANANATSQFPSISDA